MADYQRAPEKGSGSRRALFIAISAVLLIVVAVTAYMLRPKGNDDLNHAIPQISESVEPSQTAKETKKAEPGPTVAGPVQVSVSTPSARPASHKGSCAPAPVVNYTGSIGASQASTLTYRWVATDGRASSPRSYRFESAGRAAVSIAWSWTKTGNHGLALQITGPGEATSARAFVNVTCETKPVASVTLTTGTCPAIRPASVTVTAVISVTKGPVSVNYAWTGKAKGSGTHAFKGTGPQKHTVSTKVTLATKGDHPVGISVTGGAGNASATKVIKCA